MNGQENGRILFTLMGIMLTLIISVPGFSQCTDQPDAPDCACFNNAPCPVGAYCLWDPGEPGDSIQDIALATVSTRESCLCTPVGCGVNEDDAGKPYYQMVLGMNTEAGALTASYILSTVGSDAYHRREEWCSETVSYWHREAGIPYSGGYRNDWHMDWQNYCVTEMLFWYVVEEVRDGRLC